jgi:hypothetical protein
VVDGGFMRAGDDRLQACWVIAAPLALSRHPVAGHTGARAHHVRLVRSCPVAGGRPVHGRASRPAPTAQRRDA